ncbi:MAG: LPS export ABC transporter permease LptG [Natronospirillum sp.]|uniref:LPS export ABC transporter permease LptG n=1 Tax=Natronospirillum sp. TaxID=2812955 RepID=UPI0025FE5648|nr:LPS export ABC transporter permease LptG [Natronospirillum sp.]MCH8553025.1 LPS export ABC transporter permease LptG [Natronospirillum sp.]
MMTILGRYILFRTLKSILVVFMLFASLLALLGYADELSRRGSDTFTSFHVMVFTLMELPSEIYRYFFPFIVMVGTLVSVGGLSASSELTAIRATGLPASRLLATIMTPALVAIGLLFMMGEMLAPQLRLEANMYRAERLDRDEGPSFGDWYQSGNQMMNVGEFVTAERARNVFIVTLDEQGEITETVRAREVLLEPDEWRMLDVEVTEWTGTDRETARFRKLHYDEQSIEAPLSPEIIYNLGTRMRVLTLPQLRERVRFLNERAVADPVVALEFWSRATAPLLTLSITLIGIAFVFGSTRSISIGARIAMGVALALMLQIVQQFFGPAGLYLGLTPAIASLIPVIGALFVGGWLLRRNM